MTTAEIWRTLGIVRSGDTSTIRRAYAERLKAIDPDADREAFARLREARDQALHIAKQATGNESIPVEEPETTSSTAHARLEQSFQTLLVEGDQESSVSVPTRQLDDEVTFIPAIAVGFRQSDEEENYEQEINPFWLAPTLDVEDVTGFVSAGQRHTAPGHDQVIYELLLGENADREGELSSDEAAELNRQLDALLADPRLADVSFFAEAERWISEILARSCPRSDPVLEKVAVFFRWEAQADEIGQAPAIRFINVRIGTLKFLAEIQNKKHCLHRAWKELRRPSGDGMTRGWVRRRNIDELLTTVRKNYPDLEAAFDWYRVSLWENKSTSRLQWGGSIVFVVVILQVFGAIARMGNEAPTSSAEQVASVYNSENADGARAEDLLSDETGDIEAVLNASFDGQLTGSALQQRNPKLYALLQTNWRISRESGTDRPASISSMRMLLFERYAALIPHAHGSVLREFAQLRLDESAEMRIKGWQACDKFFKGETETGMVLSSAVSQRERRLAMRVLTEISEDPVQTRGPQQFSISGDIVDSASAQAGLSRDGFVQAMQDGGSAQDRCLARTALLKTALTLPEKERDRLIPKI